MKFNKVSKHTSNNTFKCTFKKAPKQFMRPIASNTATTPISTYESNQYACSQAEFILIVNTLLTSSS